MIIVILLMFIVITEVGIILQNSYDFDDVGMGMSALGGVGSLASFIALLVLVGCVINLKVIDSKIAMYQEENTKIESQITECVKQYQQYETDIFTEVTPESAVTLVALYPELKADTLVSKQIDVYLANNQKIKELKESKISGDVYRWWLYFGSSQKEGVGE